jgi:ribosome biogenesis GTPase
MVNGPAEGVVLSRAGGVYRLWVDGDFVDASLRGRLKHHSDLKVLVGDRVSFEVSEDGNITIEEVAPRTSLLQRRNPGRSIGVREVAANLDQVIAVGAAASPDWDQHMMDRFVVVAEASDLPVTVVINKIDLVDNAAGMASIYRKTGYSTITTCATDDRGIAELRGVLEGKISLFTGPTGVGKSTLLNAIQPGLKLRTGEVSKKSGAGRHTTVSAEMFPLQGGGFVVDTPGLRDIGLWGVDANAVNSAFPEIAEASAECRFDDCRHLKEPDCAVHSSVRAGDISELRLESYQRFLNEASIARKTWK